MQNGKEGIINKISIIARSERFLDSVARMVDFATNRTEWISNGKKICSSNRGEMQKSGCKCISLSLPALWGQWRKETRRKTRIFR